MFLSIAVLMLMGDKLVQIINTLHQKEKEISARQKKILEFFNMDDKELLQFIKLSRRDNLSDRQKSRLLSLLGESTRTSMLEAAAEVVEKKRQNLAALDAHELGLSSYERGICLMILQGKTVAGIAGKLQKSSSAITSARTLIRSKLGLAKEDNLRDALLKLVAGVADQRSSEAE